MSTSFRRILRIISYILLPVGAGPSLLLVTSGGHLLFANTDYIKFLVTSTVLLFVIPLLILLFVPQSKTNERRDEALRNRIRQRNLLLISVLVGIGLLCFLMILYAMFVRTFS